MLNPGELLDAVVSTYRATPDLVAALGNDASRVSAFIDRYPSDGLLLFIWDKMKPGDLLIVYHGSQLVTLSGYSLRRHLLSAVWRPPSLGGSPTSSDAYAVLPLLQDGVPTGRSVSPLYFGVLDTCQPMSVHTQMRKSIVINERGATLDYWESSFTINEIGDPQ
jgi:hypothetical protein